MENQGLINNSVSGVYLTPTECARRLNIAPVTLRKWAREGMLKAVVTPGGHRRYAVEEVVRFAKQYNLPFQHNVDEARRILIVDDDIQICRYLTELFSRFKELVVTDHVQDGFEAGHKLHTFKPNIILLDLMMPGIDGYEVCRLIKACQATQHIRVIAMTGYYTKENVEHIIGAGAEECMAKPIERDILLEMIGLNKYVRL